MKFSWNIIASLLGVFFINLISAQSDGCSSATVLTPSASCTPVSGTTAGATQTIPGCVGTADDDVWYSFVATATSHQIDVVGSASFDAVVQLFSGSCSSLVSLGCQDNTLSGGTETIYATGLTIGTTYTIRVYHYGAGSGSGSFTICVHDAPPQPSNDFCSNAIPLTVNTTCSYTAGTSLGASQTMAGCAGTADDDVWFSFVATNSVQTITVDPSTNMDAVVQLVEGVCVTFTSLYCQDNGFTNGNEVINAVGLTPGQTYYIRVYDYYGGNGGFPFNICITGNPTPTPSNDDPCSAIQIPPVTAECSYLNFTTTGATATDPTGTTTPLPSSCIGGSGAQMGGYSSTSADVWFAITVPSNGNIFINPQPNYGISDGVMALYSGSCGSLTQITCSDDNNYPGSANDLKPYINATGLTPGSTVYLRYWGYGSTQGDFGLCVSSPTNDACANALYICDINGYSASTSAAYTPDRPGTGAGQMYGNGETSTGVFMGNLNTTHTGGPFGYPNGSSPSGYYNVTIDNNSWITFTASATTATLTVTIYDCWVGNYPSGGVQMQVFSGTNCDNFVSVSNFEESSTGFVITATGLTVGQDYYLMVDGYAGDICSYTITADSGVQFPDITATNNPICAGNSTTLTAPAGATSYLWYPGGQTTQSISVTPSTTTTYSCVVGGVCGYKQTLSKTITVNQLPTLTSSSTGTICSGNNVNMNIVTDINSTYQWSATSNSNVTGESTTTQLGSTINDVLSTSLTTQQTVNYTIIPTAISSGCVGNPQSVSINVNPAPTMTSSASQTICSGGSVNIPLTSNISSSYSWVAANNANTTGESTVAQATSTINDAITNSSSTAQTVNYTVTPTSTSGGCAGTAQSVAVTVNPAPTMTSAASTTICSGNGVNLTLTSNISSSYSWSAVSNASVSGESTTTQTTSTIGDVLTNGTSSVQNVTYNVTPTSTSGSCAGSSQTVTVAVNPLPTMTSSASQTICSGGSVNIPLTANVSSGYSWVAANNANTTGESTVAQTTSTINDAITNSTSTAQTVNYTVTPTSTSGSCVGNAQSVAVTVNPSPTMSSSASQTICSGGSVNIPLTSNISSSYSWVAANNVNTTGESTVAQATSTINDAITNSSSTAQTVNYTVTPTSTSGGCSGTTQSVAVTVNPAPTMTSAASTTICSGNGVNLSLTSNISSSFSWSAVSNASVSGESTTTQTTSTIGDVLTNGTSSVQNVTYNVTPTSTSGSCAGSSQTVTVAVNPLPTMTSSASQTICTGSNVNIPLTANMSSGYSWVAVSNANVGGESTTAQTTSTVNDALTNTTTTAQTVNYTVTPTSTSGSCVGNAQTVAVTVNPLDDASFNYTGGNTYCLTGTNPTATVSGLSGGTFSISGGATINPTDGTIDLGASGVGTYTVTYTTNGSCPNTSTTSVNITTAPDATFSYANATYCATGTATVNFGAGASAGTFSVSSSGLSINSSNGTLDLANSSAGTYTITNNIAPAGGCAAATANTTVTVNALPNIAANATNSTVCSGQQITLTGSGATSYTWDNGVTDGVAFTPSATTTYTVTGTDANNCQNTSQITITVNALPTVTANASSTGVCDGQSVTLNGGGAVSYTWNNGVTDGAAFTPSVGTITYTVTGTDANTCQNTAQVTVTVNALPTVTGGANQTVCDGQTVTLSGSGATSYTWDNGVTDGVAFTPAVGTTTYNVTGTDANSCSNTASVNVTVNPLDDASFSYSTTTYCASGTNPTPTVTGLSGGVFSITGGATINSADGTIDLGASGVGTYTVTYTTNGTCPNTQTVSINVTTAPDATFSYSQASYCQVGTDAPSYPVGSSGGAFSATPSGLNVDPVTGNIDLTTSAAGTYTITNYIAPSGGCAPATATTTLDVLPPDDNGFTYSSASFCTSDGNQIPTISTPGGTFTSTGGLIFTDGSPSSTGEIDFTNTPVGTYTVTYTTNGNCVNDSTVSVTISNQLSATLSVTNDSLCADANAVLITPVDNGGIWSGTGVDNNGNFDPAVAGIGTHQIIYSISGSCGDADTLYMVVKPVPQVSLLGDTVCDGGNALLVASGNGGTINWYSDPGLTTLVASDTNQYSPSGSGISTYYVQETLNGCVGNIDSANANVFNLTAGFTATPTSGNLPLSVSFTNTSAVVDTLNDQFYWTFGTGDSSSDFEPSYTYNDPGTFNATLVVINSEGMCTDTAQVVIEVNGEFTIEIPNIFTPNGDDANDVFHINATNVKEVKAEIYDRWGLHMYGWDGINGGWDGRTKAGIEASEGTYFYFIEVIDLFGEQHKYEGPFNLNR